VLVTRRIRQRQLRAGRQREVLREYPLGYPALCVLAYKLGGPTAVFLVNPILAALAVLGTFFLGRHDGRVCRRTGGDPPRDESVARPISPTPAESLRIDLLCGLGNVFLVRWTESGGKWNAFLAGALSASCEHRALHGRPVGVAIIAMVAWRYFKVEHQPICNSRPRVYLNDRLGAHRRDPAADSSWRASAPPG